MGTVEACLLYRWFISRGARCRSTPALGRSRNWSIWSWMEQYLWHNQRQSCQCCLCRVKTCCFQVVTVHRPLHLCSKCFFWHLCLLEDLQRHPVCLAAAEGGGRMYPIAINLRAESDLRASVCAHMLVEVEMKHFVTEGRFVKQPQPTLLTSSRLFMGFLTCGCTQYLTDLWPMINVQEWLSYMGHNSKIRPIFVLYEWCSVIFL